MCSSVNRSVKRIWTRYRMTWISNVPSTVVSLAPSDNRSNGFLGNPTFSFSLPSVICTTSSGTIYIYIYLFLPTAILFRISAFASVNLCRINFIVSLQRWIIYWTFNLRIYLVYFFVLLSIFIGVKVHHDLIEEERMINVIESLCVYVVKREKKI